MNANEVTNWTAGDFDWSEVQWRDIGGIQQAVYKDQAVHWNRDVPGGWVGPYTLATLGSCVSSFCEDRPGVYRLIGLDYDGRPAALDRLCELDRTGTLYIGAEGKTFANRSRLTQLVRSLRERGRVYNSEHKAGHRLRTHAHLSTRFPPDRIALTWCYCDLPMSAERALFEVYFSSFGDTPPLNFRTSLT